MSGKTKDPLVTNFETQVWETYVRFVEKITECRYGVLDTGNANMLVFQQIAATLTQATMTSELNRTMASICDEMPSAGRGI